MFFSALEVVLEGDGTLTEGEEIERGGKH